MAIIDLHKLIDPSSETNAAQYLYDLFSSELKEYEGKIWIVPSVHMNPGTGRHDIDILLLGYLDKPYILDDLKQYGDYNFYSFCTTIEVKSHGADGIEKDGTRLTVKYGYEKTNYCSIGKNQNKVKQSDVNKQSEEQKTSLISYFNNNPLFRNLKTPFVTNLIWLVGVDDSDYENLATDNSLSCNPSIEEIFTTIANQSNLKYHNINAFYKYSTQEIEDVADLFCAKIKGADTMSLRKLNALQQKTYSNLNLDKNKDKIIVLSGHAGTGKTIMLLQSADTMAKKGKKCLFLTYNTALISDIKHSLSFLPTIRNLSVKFESMHSLFIGLLFANGLWDKTKNFDTDFSDAIKTLNRRQKINNNLSSYDYVFIDEAQDWDSTQVQLIKRVFDSSQLVIADGIDQFMMSEDSPEWGISSLPKLKKCLRQRRNLTVFVKMFAAKMGVSWNVEPNEELPGGNIIITNQFDPDLYKEIEKQAFEHDCKNYDIMFLAPNSLVKDGAFEKLDTYKQLGINLYDGINKQTRDTEYSAKNQGQKECRVYTYESCRGLEAWTTICLRFGELFDLEHHHDYRDIKYTTARRYLLTLWTLIPLTRAVDTLVIIIDQNSSIIPILKSIAEETPDYVELRMQ